MKPGGTRKGDEEASLRSLLGEYLDHDSFPRAEQQLRAAPELLGTAVDRILLTEISTAERHQESATVARLRQHRAFLRRCRTEGLDRVFLPGSRDIDPAVVADIREALSTADAAESRFDRTAAPEALREAGAMWRSIVAHPALSAAYPALRAAVLNDAGGVLLRCAWVDAAEDDLASAVRAFEQAVVLTPPGSPLMAGRLANLGIGTRECYRRTSDPSALQEALRVLRAAVTSPGEQGQLAARSNLALCLEDLYLRDGDVTHLDEAISGCESALGSPRVEGAVHTDLLVQLGNMLRRRFDADADVVDLEGAVTSLQEAVDGTADASPHRPRRLVDLGIALLDRNAVRGDPEDLARAMELMAEANRTIAPRSSDRPGCLAHLGLGHYRRYEVVGTLDDLDLAVALLDEAVRLTAGRGVDAAAWGADLASVLRERARLSGDGDELDRAVHALRTSISAAAPASPQRPAYLTDLGNLLRDRYGASGDLGDLDIAVVLLEQAVGSMPPSSTNHGTTVANLGAALRDRYLATHSVTDLNRGVALLREAAASRLPNETDRPRRLCAFAMALADRYDLSGDTEDRRKAQAAFAEGCAVGLHTDPEASLQAGDRWGSWAAAKGWWDQAATAYGAAMTALLTAVGVQVVREHKESWLMRGASLSARAAQALAAVGRLPDAVRDLEAGRGVLLSETLDRDHADLRGLAEEHGDLAARYQRSVQRLRALQRGTAHDAGGLFGRALG
jgi:tetratricopeptide (TPR) repeat protein